MPDNRHPEKVYIGKGVWLTRDVKILARSYCGNIQKNNFGVCEKIAQVVNNLLTNAIKYSPEGGDIEVEVRLFRSDLELDRILGDARLANLKVPCLVVSIADSGIGIPEEELDRIFDKFYRVNNKLTRTVPGVGLGLYICKILVEAHNGHIWARNRLTGGSIFSFSLPVS